MSKGSVRKANTLVRSIQHKIKALQKGLPIDKVKTRPAVGANITDYEVNVARNSTDQCVKRTGPDLSIGSQFEKCLVNVTL